MGEDYLKKELLKRGISKEFPSVNELSPDFVPKESSRFLIDDTTLGRETMREVRTDESFRLAPTIPKMTRLPDGSTVVPVRAYRRISAHELGAMRRFMEPSLINERMVSDLMKPLLKQLDEMGLIDLQVTQVDKDQMEYSIVLRVLKNEYGNN